MFKSSKLEASADINFEIYTRLLKFSDCIESIGGKEENAGYQHFLLFPQQSSLISLLEVGHVCNNVKGSTIITDPILNISLHGIEFKVLK